ncbi:MAG: glycosyltransferase, partial [Anaerolineales bacterium]|nr:glycosyltransferase [Anaerolineales bacterium]
LDEKERVIQEKEYAIQDGAQVIQEKEREIQKSAQAIQEKERMIQEKESTIQEKEKFYWGKINLLEADLSSLTNQVLAQQNELIAKEAVIQSFRNSTRFWVENGPLGKLALVRLFFGGGRGIRDRFLPKLGVLSQYPPRPLQIPARYRKESRLPDSQLPVISIVTPSYNQAVFLERTIESVLNQDYGNLEYAVQDGKSTDGSDAVLDKYRARLVHAESVKDSGQANAINLGFSHTTGDIMAYLNSDDVLLPGTLHYVARYFAKHPNVDVVYGHRLIVDENDAEIGVWVVPPHDKKMLEWGDYVPQETMFWRRGIWDKSGGKMDESFQFALDWDLLLRFQSAGAKIVRLPRFLSIFRVHGAQKSTAQINDLGIQEMNLLRKRVHGREVHWTEINDNLKPYLRRSVIYHKLYRLGVLRY